MQKIDRTGETRINNQGSNMKIIVYRNKRDIDVQFDNGYISEHRRYDDFKRGAIKNLKFPSVCGIGYIGGQEYKVSNNRKTTIAYDKWYRMISRCYSDKEKERFPTYEKCTVCNEWLNFQNFAEWLKQNYYQVPNEVMCLDKDILFKGNKLYAPNKCCIVPDNINILFTKSDAIRGEYPIGVTWNKSHSCFVAHMNKNGKLLQFGEFDNPTDAFYKYKIEKEKEIKRQANKYKKYLPVNVYKALIKYEVEIND